MIFLNFQLPESEFGEFAELKNWNKILFFIEIYLFMNLYFNIKCLQALEKQSGVEAGEKFIKMQGDAPRYALTPFQGLG